MDKRGTGRTDEVLEELILDIILLRTDMPLDL